MTERKAAKLAYEAGLGASEWKAFMGQTLIPAAMLEATVDAVQRILACDQENALELAQAAIEAAGVPALIERNAELERLFELQHDADQRAIQAWQAAHPDKPDMWPDRADLVVWLIEQNDGLRFLMRGQAAQLMREQARIRVLEATMSGIYELAKDDPPGDGQGEQQ